MKSIAHIELAQLIRKIEDHQSELNQKGLWLFLTTLACWSTKDGFQIIAILCTLSIFTYYVRLLFKKKGKGTLHQQLKELGTRHSNDFSDDQIEKLRIQHLSNYSIVKSSIEFFIGYSFAAATFMYFVGFPRVVVFVVFIGFWLGYLWKWKSSYDEIERNKQKELEESLQKYEGMSTQEMIELLKMKMKEFEQDVSL